MSQLKYKYLGWEAGYIYSLEPGDITVEQWEQLPPAIQEHVRLAPHCYQLVEAEPAATPAVLEAPKE